MSGGQFDWGGRPVLVGDDQVEDGTSLGQIGGEDVEHVLGDVYPLVCRAIESVLGLLFPAFRGDGPALRENRDLWLEGFVSRLFQSGAPDPGQESSSVGFNSEEIAFCSNTINS